MSAEDVGVSIGRNEAVAYGQKVRAAVMPIYRDCVNEAGSPVTEDPVLVDVAVLPDGKVREVLLHRSSGNPAVDDCGRKAFVDASLPAPPARLIGESGSHTMPPFAFTLTVQ